MGEKADLLISQGNLLRDSLKGKVAVVTGAAGGVGYEAARALMWLGAKVVVVDVDEEGGRVAVENLNREFGAGEALFVKADVGDDKEVEAVAAKAAAAWRKVDIVVNSAAVFAVGAVKDTTVDAWDLSYRVHLRGPLLLARTFLSGMIKRKYGVFAFASSSFAAPFTGAYGVLRAAQVELASVIAAEVEGSGVCVFTVDVGAVKAPAFLESTKQVSALTGLKLKQLLTLSRQVEVSAEEAGTAVAGAVALALRYHGRQASWLQVLQAMGIKAEAAEAEKPKTNVAYAEAAYAAFQVVLKTFSSQVEGWRSCNLFRRQWLAREFKRSTGLSMDEMYNTLVTLGKCLEMKTSATEFVEPLKKLADYYRYQQELLRGLAKVSKKTAEDLQVIEGWILEVNALLKAIGG
ncbi:MAG: SDR family NAD(P)-dependent oxidoreductase [Candidatus Bathyarchaeia archaeon]|jgi:NAD(P)-dependent dehydrogenase (short-subunit alcohol dehydrogenase family)